MKLSEIGFLFADIQGLQGEPASILVLESIARRFQSPGTWITLWLCLGLVLGLMLSKIHSSGLVIPKSKPEMEVEVPSNKSLPQALAFVLVLIGAGAVIVLVPEFVYLRDQFGTRMNTIFKFYYQGWLLWSIAASIGVIFVFKLRADVFSQIMRIAVIIFIGIGLLYPVIGIELTTRGISSRALTLDGNAYIQIYQPDEKLAMDWLTQAEPGVLAEAVGGSYTAFARMSTQTGYPTVMGWIPHEGQWGRGPKEFGTRIEDVATLYETNLWEEAQFILDRYAIRYVDCRRTGKVHL